MTIEDCRLKTEDWRGLRAAVCLMLALASCARAPKPVAQPVTPAAATAQPPTATSAPSVALGPVPATVELRGGPAFQIDAHTPIVVNTADVQATSIARQLALFLPRSLAVAPTF